jgi:diadenosine tetraphosphate (Ap4A) HIT family hydrolase
VLRDHVEHLDDLDQPRQLEIFADVARVARAIRSLTTASPRPRINYECLGNVVPHLHWHVIPRHADDPFPRQPVWTWPDDVLKAPLGEMTRRTLIQSLRSRLHV